MPKPSHRLKAKNVRSAFTKPLTVNFKDLFKALSKGIAHVALGKWEELAADTVEAIAAIGLATDPGELATLLLRRATTQAVFDLVGESAAQLSTDVSPNTEALARQLEKSYSDHDIEIGKRFFDRPSDLPILTDVKQILKLWLR